MRCLVVSGLFLAVLFAQSPMKTGVALPADEAAYQKALAVVQPAAQLGAILQFLSAYPNSRSVPMMIHRGFLAAGKAGPWNRARAVELAGDMARRLAKASPMARSEAARALAINLSASSGALAEAEQYARQATKDLNADDQVSREQQWYRQKVELSTARDPKYKPIPFYPEEAREKYRKLEAAAWYTLGRILINQGRDAEARQALQKSLAAARTAEAAGAYAELAAKQGDTHTVLDALGTAILGGKADSAMVEKFQAAYRESGMRPDPEAWLDRRYRLEFRNPLQPPGYRGTPAEPRRAVLLEIVTGAACEPCVSVDLAVDALLHRYGRQGLVVLTHHMHAPATDPLVSAASDERIKFYEVRSAPAVILDGETIEPGEGTGAVAQPVFDALDAAIQKRLSAAGGARIQLKTSWSGDKLRVEAAVEGVETSAGVGLDLFLAETEVSYSGENGVRLHPMVARDHGVGTDWTVAVDPAKRNRLAIVAVVQDLKTRRVVQSAYRTVDGQ